MYIGIIFFIVMLSLMEFEADKVRKSRNEKNRIFPEDREKHRCRRCQNKDINIECIIYKKYIYLCTVRKGGVYV